MKIKGLKLDEYKYLDKRYKFNIYIVKISFLRLVRSVDDFALNL